MGDSSSASCGKPPGSLCRSGQKLVPMKEYKVSHVYRELSKFPNSQTNECEMKTIVAYKDMNMWFYTYLCKDYNDKTPEDIKKYNDDIEKGHNIRLIYYGSVGKYNMTRLLLDGERPDLDIVRGMTALSNSQAPTCIMKRKRDDDDEQDCGPSSKGSKV